MEGSLSCSAALEKAAGCWAGKQEEAERPRGQASFCRLCLLHFVCSLSNVNRKNKSRAILFSFQTSLTRLQRLKKGSRPFRKLYARGMASY